MVSDIGIRGPGAQSDGDEMIGLEVRYGSEDGGEDVNHNQAVSSALRFSIPKNRSLGSLEYAWLEVTGSPLGELRFMYDGMRIQATETPRSLYITDGDVIDVFLGQTGGGTAGEDEGGDGKTKDAPEIMTITVKNAHNQEIAFKLTSTGSLTKLMIAYAKRQGRTPDSLRFYTSTGTRILDGDTPAKLEMVDGEVIEAMEEQHGGFCSF